MRHSRQQSHHFRKVWSNPNFVISSQGCSYFFWQRCLSLWSSAAEWLKSQGELIKVPILVLGWQSVARCLGILREVILKSNLQFITVNSLRRVICRSSVEILTPPLPYTDWRITIGLWWRHRSAGKSGCLRPRPHISW